MLNWLLIASEVLVLAALNLVPARARGRVSLTPETLSRAKAGEIVQLVLPEDGLLHHRLTLPDKRRSDNRAWLSARIETLSPWEQNAFLWDSKTAPDHIDLAILPLAPVTDAERILTQIGARLTEVKVGQFWFRRDAAQLRRWRDRLALTVGFVTVLALGLAGVGVQGFWQAQDRSEVSLAALERSEARLKEGAGPAQAALALLERKSGSVALALSHLAQALPQDSYVTTLSVTDQGIDISGQTQKPDGIIPSLSADPVFATINFAGPASYDPVPGGFSFAIQATLGVLP